MGNFREDLCTFMISLWLLRRMRNVLDKSCREALIFLTRTRGWKSGCHCYSMLSSKTCSFNIYAPVTYVNSQMRRTELCICTKLQNQLCVDILLLVLTLFVFLILATSYPCVETKQLVVYCRRRTFVNIKVHLSSSFAVIIVYMQSTCPSYCIV
jgi:hypothetical protein